MNISSTKESSLADVHWRVVEMARGDGPQSIDPDGFWARFSSSFFGVHTRGLANGQLEALRRFCVRAWYWDLIRVRDLNGLLKAGYSMADALQILAHVAERRGFSPSMEGLT